MALTARMATIDCADPPGLAMFWLAAIGYEVRADDGGTHVVPARVGSSVSGRR